MLQKNSFIFLNYLYCSLLLFAAFRAGTAGAAGQEPPSLLLKTTEAVEFATPAIYHTHSVTSSKNYQQANALKQQAMLEKALLEAKWQPFFSEKKKSVILYLLRSLGFSLVLVALYIFQTRVGLIHTGVWFGNKVYGTTDPEGNEIRAYTWNDAAAGGPASSVYFYSFLHGGLVVNGVMAIAFWAILQKNPIPSYNIMTAVGLICSPAALIYYLYRFIYFFYSSFSDSFGTPMKFWLNERPPYDPLEASQLFYIAHKPLMLKENPLLVKRLEKCMHRLYNNYSEKEALEVASYVKQGTAFFLATRQPKLRIKEDVKFLKGIASRMKYYPISIRKNFIHSVKDLLNQQPADPLCLIGKTGTGKTRSVLILEEKIAQMAGDKAPVVARVNFLQRKPAESVEQTFIRQVTDQFLRKVKKENLGQGGLLLIHLDGVDKALMSEEIKDTLQDWLLKAAGTDAQNIYMESFDVNFNRSWMLWTINEKKALSDPISNRLVVERASFTVEQKEGIMFEEGLLQSICRKVKFDIDKLTEEDKNKIKQIIQEESKNDEGLRGIMIKVGYYLREKKSQAFRA